MSDERNYPFAAYVAERRAGAYCKTCTRVWSSVNAKSLAVQHTKATGHDTEAMQSFSVRGIQNVRT
jgi:hypothetical protein